MLQEEKTWEKDQESKEAKNTKKKQEGQNRFEKKTKLTNQMTTKTMNQSTGYGQSHKARKLGGRKAAKDSR